MVIVIVFSLILGIILLLIEIFIIPGITIAAIGGVLLTAGGIFLSYKKYGTEVGNQTVLITAVAFILSLIFMFKSKSLKKIALNSEIDSKVNVLNEELVHVGDTGITVSRLAPMGKVSINGHVYEAKSTGHYINENTEIEVIKLNESNIIVKPLK
jgi:membrane-bound ClpP family serine protease